jgi:hypothetical protein
VRALIPFALAALLAPACAGVVVDGETNVVTVEMPGQCVPDCGPESACDPASQFAIVCTGGVDVSALYCALSGEQRCGGDVWCCEGTPD